jgi:D-sedoheptulose 7-phosphate isomerase
MTAARADAIAAWGLTGPALNPLAEVCDEAVSVHPGGGARSLTVTMQEAYELAVHLVCLPFDAV